MKRDLNCFDPNSIELCIFCGLYFDFVLLPVFKYKALVGVSSSSIWVLYQSRIFPCSHGAKKHHRLVLFWARTLQSFYYFFMFSFMALANLATSPKRQETDLTNITRRHFCSLPVICIKHSFIYFLLSECFPLFVCFDTLWQLATTHATGTQIVRAKITSLDAIVAGKTYGGPEGSQMQIKNVATD